jgi:hypothetical protein
MKRAPPLSANQAQRTFLAAGEAAYEAARLHHAYPRHGVVMAARGARAAGPKRKPLVPALESWIRP